MLIISYRHLGSFEPEVAIYLLYFGKNLHQHAGGAEEQQRGG